MVGWRGVLRIVEPGESRLKRGAHNLMTDDESMDSVSGNTTGLCYT